MLTEVDEIKSHLLSQFHFFLLFGFAFFFPLLFPFPIEGHFLLLKNVKKAIGDLLELRLTSCLDFGPLIQTHPL